MGYIQAIREKVGHDAIFMPAAAGFVYQNGKILLQQRADNHKWAANGGALEFTEMPEEALKREMSEELGITPLNATLVGIYSGPEQHFIYPNQDEVYVVAAIYLVEQYEGQIAIDPQEVLRTAWFALDELPDKSEINLPDLQPLLDTIKLIRSRENPD